MEGGARIVPADAELVSRSLHGDDLAFTELAVRHRPWLLRFIRRYVGNDDDAGDLLQDSLVSAWQALNRYQPERDFSAWIRQIALNKCRDWTRRTFVRRIVSRFAGDLDLLPAEVRTSNPEILLTVSQALRRLDQAIAALPLTLREPFILTVFEGLSHRETAVALKVSEKAVETRVGRARQRLAEVVDRSELSILIEDTTP